MGMFPYLHSRWDMPEVIELLLRAAEPLIVRWKQKKFNIKVVVIVVMKFGPLSL